MQHGILVTFEGIEGCGKSTQARLLEDFLRTRGYPVMLTREPGHGEFGQSIRSILVGGAAEKIDALTELFLLEADRTHHVNRFIRPALDQGEVVICDRFSDSSLAYQGYGRGIAVDFVNRLNNAATSNLAPDLTIILDLDTHFSLERSQTRLRQQDLFDKEGRFEREGMSFHQRVREGYLKIAHGEPQRCHVFDGTLDIDALSQQISRLVLTRLAQFFQIKDITG